MTEQVSGKLPLETAPGAAQFDESPIGHELAQSALGVQAAHASNAIEQLLGRLRQYGQEIGEINGRDDTAVAG